MSMVLLMLFLFFLFVRRIAGYLRREKQGKAAEAEKKSFVSMAEPAREAFSELTEQVGELVRADYPECRWIWETPEAMQEIMLGGEVYILLNRAGGYRRAKVIYRNLNAVALDYRLEKEVFPEGPPEPELFSGEPLEDNYELLAFQWTEAHIPELSGRCSDAARQGKNELLIPFDELPAPESWQDICRELARNQLAGAKVVTDGILILL